MRRLLALSALAAVWVGLASLGHAQAGPDWEQIVAAGKREGKVVIKGPPATETTDALTVGFQKRYPQIQAEVSAMTGNQMATKLITELNAGMYLADLIITGTTTALEVLLPANAVVPASPFLAGPNARDASGWRRGKFSFGDDAGRYNLVFSVYVKAPFIYNPNLVSAQDFKSWKDLLGPKWKGKMVMRDPTGAGGGLGVATFWYTHEALGKEYIRQFFTQDVAIARDDRQILDFAAKGKYPIAIGPSDTLTNEFVGKGLPLKHMNPENLREGTYITAGNGSFVIVRNAPHPNALKVYLDYLLSKDGQLEWSKVAGFASLRGDVPRDHVPDILVPKEGMDYPELHKERYLKLRGEIVSFVKTVMPR
jgi:ABC-type Fe3+ transport system substrate-binding protein